MWQKLFLGFVIVVTIVAIEGYICIHLSQKELQKNIEETSASLTSEILNDINTNLERRIEAAQHYSNTSAVQQALSESNKEFEKLNDIQVYINEKDQAWTSTSPKEITPFMQEIIDSKVSGELRDIIKFYENRHNYKVFNEFIITNKYGVNIAQTGKTTDYYQADEQWWQGAKKEGLYIEDVEYDESADVYATSFGVRIDDKSGNFSGVIKAVLNIEDTIKILADKKYPNAKFKLLTRDKKIICATEEFEFLQNLPIEISSFFSLEQGMPKQSNCFISKCDCGKGENVLYAYAHSERQGDYKNLGWILLIEYKTKEIFASVSRLRNLLLFILLIFIAFAVLLGLFISYSIHKPLVNLNCDLVKIGEGKPDTKVTIKSKDEIGFLTNSFNKVMDSLSETTTRIRRQQEMLESINTIFRETLMCESDIDVAQQCLKLSEKLTGSKFGFIGELNEAGLFDTIAISNPGWDACKMPDSEATKLIKNMPLRGVDRSTLRDGKSRIVNDIDSHPDHIEIPKEHPKITCFLGIPLKRKDRTVGMIGLANREGGYTLENQETVETLSTAFIEALYHKRMEKEVEKSEERYRQITNAITDYIYTVHIEEGHIVETVHNPNSVFVTGYTPKELTATPSLLTKMVHDEDREAVHRQVSQCLSGQDIEPLEHRIVHKDGSTRWVRNTLVRRNVDPQERLLSYDVLLQDITKYKQTLESSSKSETKYRTLVENIPQKVFLKDQNSVYISCNESFAKDLKIKSLDIDGKTDYDFFPKELAEKYRADDKRIMGLEKTESIEEKYIDNGKEIIVNTIKTPVKDRQGNIIGLLGIFCDITDRKHAEESAAKAYEELKRSHQELKELQSQLVQSEKLASIGQLAAGVAHEMNNPVGFVAGNFQTLESHVKKILELLAMHDKLAGQVENLGDPQLKTVIDGIGQFREDMQIEFILEDIQRLFVDSKEGVDRTVEIIQNLRDFSRIDQPGSRDKYDLNEGIKATLVMAKNEIKYDADVETDLSELPLIYCHCGQINQVLLNILVNAAQAIKSQERDDRGTIKIKTYASDDGVVCEISDDGPGIAPENTSKIFDPFFTTKPPGKGTGLGLNISYGIIVNNHNGELLVDSKVGEGTKFTINLPISTKENEEEKEKISNGKKDSIICR